MALALFWPATFAQAQKVKGEVSRVGDATHLEFKGLSQWAYELKKLNDKQFTLVLPAFDDATVALLNTWSDSLVTGIEVKRDGADGQYRVIFSVADSSVESFDYLTDDPSRLILDFYKQAPAAKAESEPSTQEAPSPTATPPAAQLPAKKGKQAKKAGPSGQAQVDEDGYQKKTRTSGRKPAGDERLSVSNLEEDQQSQAQGRGGAFDAADPNFDRLRIKDYEVREDAIIASRRNIYVQFPMLKQPISQIENLLANLPEFVIQPKDGKENKEARLLLSLYERQVAKTDRTRDRIGAFLKLYDHFVKSYPESEYDEIVKNLAAHIYFLRWQASGNPEDHARSQTLYKYLLNRYPESPLAERQQLWLAYSALDHRDGLGVLQEFQEYLRRYPQSAMWDEAQKALAEGYLILNKFDEAAGVYSGLEKNARHPDNRIDAAYRLGDVKFARKDYAGAVASYRSAISKFPKELSRFPSAQFNLGEALFWQRNLRESLDAHVEFLQSHPDHDFGGYAMTRAGEILEALGADRSRVMGAYLESYFRYRKNPGAEVARVRLLSQRMRGMKEKELRKSIEEIKEIGAHSPLPKMAEFAKLMTADGYQGRGNHEEALKELINYYQANPTTSDLSLFRARIHRNIAEMLSQRLNQGDFLKVLAVHGQYARNWLQNSERLDVPYAVARAYEQAGAYDKAKAMYEDLLERRLKMAGTAIEKEKRVNEILPSASTLNLRLAAVATQERQYPEAYRHLKALGANRDLDPSERIEAVRLRASVSIEQGQLDQARQALEEFIEGWKGKTEDVTEARLQLAEVQLKARDPEAAEKIADFVIGAAEGPEAKSSAAMAKALELKGDALLAQGKDIAAVEVYQRLLEDFESKMPLASVRFRTGEILYKRGDLAAAEKVWLALDGKKNAALRRVAEDRLASARWQDEHRRYLKRIPAMSDFKEE